MESWRIRRSPKCTCGKEATYLIGGAAFLVNCVDSKTINVVIRLLRQSRALSNATTPLQESSSREEPSSPSAPKTNRQTPSRYFIGMLSVCVKGKPTTQESHTRRSLGVGAFNQTKRQTNVFQDPQMYKVDII